eukprot:1521997-Rhodomonas_salina.1
MGNTFIKQPLQVQSAHVPCGGCLVASIPHHMSRFSFASVICFLVVLSVQAQDSELPAVPGETPGSSGNSSSGSGVALACAAVSIFAGGIVVAVAAFVNMRTKRRESLESMGV